MANGGTRAFRAGRRSFCDQELAYTTFSEIFRGDGNRVEPGNHRRKLVVFSLGDTDV